MAASGDGMFYNFIRTVGLQTVASFMPGLTAHFFAAFFSQTLGFNKGIRTRRLRAVGTIFFLDSTNSWIFCFSLASLGLKLKF
jgi:hypothetical protein